MDNDYTRRDYTLRGGKDAAIADKRQRMGEEQHSRKNSMVKQDQNEMKSMEGRAPEMADRYMKFDACMTNNGAHAQEFARTLTKGLDKKAFPVRDFVDMSQD